MKNQYCAIQGEVGVLLALSAQVAVEEKAYAVQLSHLRKAIREVLLPDSKPSPVGGALSERFLRERQPVPHTLAWGKDFEAALISAARLRGDTMSRVQLQHIVKANPDLMEGLSRSELDSVMARMPPTGLYTTVLLQGSVSFSDEAGLMETIDQPCEECPLVEQIRAFSPANVVRMLKGGFGISGGGSTYRELRGGQTN